MGQECANQLFDFLWPKPDCKHDFSGLENWNFTFHDFPGSVWVSNEEVQQQAGICWQRAEDSWY